MRNEARERSDAKDSVGCVGSQAVSVVQMAKMDATQKRVWEVRPGGRERRDNTHSPTNTFSQWNDCNSLQIFHWPFTRVFATCGSSISLPVLHFRLSHSTRCTRGSSAHSQTFSTMDRAWLPALLHFQTVSSPSWSLSSVNRVLLLFFPPVCLSSCFLASEKLFKSLLLYLHGFSLCFYRLWQHWTHQWNCWDLGIWQHHYNKAWQGKKLKQLDNQTGCKQASSLARLSDISVIVP